MSVTLQDAKVKQTLKRHFVCYSVDANKTTPDIQAFFGKTKANVPFLIFVNERGQYIEGSGFKKADEFQALLTKVLEDKAFAANKAQEAALTKQVDALGKIIDDKEYVKAGPVVAAINKIRGYSATRDKYYDLLEPVQADAEKVLVDTATLVKNDEYTEARQNLDKVIKDYGGLPVVDQAKDHLAAVKLLEAANQLIKDKKTNYKAQAAQRFDFVQQKHADTPYAGLAGSRKKELAGGK